MGVKPLFSDRWMRALSPRRSSLFLLSTALLPVFWLLVRTVGLSRLHAALIAGKSREQGRPGTGDPRTAGEIVNAAGRMSPFPVTCLTRSLTLLWILRRRGMDVELRIGTRIDEGRFEAHAWVECDGIAVNDTPGRIGAFAAFERLPRHPGPGDHWRERR